MKKISALLLALILIFGLAACGGDGSDKTVSAGEVVDQNTVDIVSNAYSVTKAALANAKALSYSGNAVVSTTVDGATVSVRTTVNLDYIDTDDGRTFAASVISKSGEASEECQLYGNGTDTYGYKVGTTYLLSKKEATTKYIDELFGEIEYLDLSAVNVLKTTIVDTSVGGHGFVLDLDFNDTSFDPETVFGSNLYAEKSAGIETKPTALSVSGIIDAEGRLTEQKVTFKYNYDVVASTGSDVSSTESAGKNVTAELTVTSTFKYDLASVQMPDRIDLGDGENSKKPTEISVQDFTALTSSGASSDKASSTAAKK